MRASWQGYIALGNLGIPVRLFTATQTTEPRFVLLHEADGSPIERPWRCKAEQRDITHDETIRAVEDTPGHYIPLSDHELEQTAVGPVQSLGIIQFCDNDIIPPQYYAKPFYVVPGKGGERAYALLREVFDRTGRAAAVTFMLHGKEHIGLLRTYGDLIMLYQLRFAAEIFPRGNLKTPALPKPTPNEIDALTAVIERFSGPFYIEDYHNEHAERVTELVERKAKGLKSSKHERPAPHATPESDILPALQHTLNEQRLLSSG